MKVLFKRENLKLTISTILYLIFGVLFCVVPVRMFNFAEMALCVLLLGIGIVCVVIYSLMSHDDKPFKMLVYGIIAVVLGVLILMWPRMLGIVVSVIVGFSGILLVLEFCKNRKKGIKTNITELVIGIIVTILSVIAIVLSGTNVSKNLLSIFFGVTSISSSSHTSQICDSLTTTGMPIAITGIPKESLLSPLLRFPTPAPGVMPASLSCIVSLILSHCAAARESTATTQVGLILSHIAPI